MKKVTKISVQEAMNIIKQSEEQLKDVQRIAHVGSWELNLSTNELVWSEEIYTIFEIDPEKFGASYKIFLGTIHPADRKMVNKSCTDLLKNHLPYSLDYRLLMKDGRVKYIHEQCEVSYDSLGKARRLIGIIQDVTERKSLEKELKIIFDGSSDGILLVEPVSKKLFRANRTICQMLGRSSEEIEKLSIADISPRENLPFVLKQFANIVQGKTSLARNVPLKRKDASIFYVDINSSTVDINGKKYFLGLFRDITETIKYQEALISSETKYRRLFEAAKDGILILDAKTGEIREVNPYLMDMLGYSHKEFLKKKLWEIGLFKDIVASKEAFEKLKRRKYIHYENLPLQTKTGGTIHVEFVSNVYPINHHEVIQCNIRDITARYNAEEKVINNEIRFRAIFENSPVAIALVSLDDYFISVNPAAVKLWGYSEAELKKMTFADITHPDEVKRDIAQAKRLVKGEIDVYNINKRYIRKDKKIIFARVKVTLAKDAEHRPLYLLKIIEDITEHHHWEEAIKKSEEKYSTFVEQSSDGVLVVQNGLIRYGNKAIQEMTGYRLSEVIKRPVNDFVIDKYKKMVAEKYAQRLSGRPTANRYEFELIKKNGQNLFVETNSSLIDFEGQPAVMAIIRDITRAKQVDKIKSEFISVASHQLRGPLTGIKWFSQLLIEQKAGKLSAKQIDFIQQIYNSNERMIRLINDLLDVSHIETGQKFTIKKKPGDIIALINKVIKDQKINSPTREIIIGLDKSYPDKFVFSFDQDKIYQVFSNLLNNSIKYSRPNKKIIIGLKRLDDEVRLSVQDFGFGIPASQKDRIFQKFFRADNIATISTEGTGLGLYITKGIVEAHGGKIWFESEHNKGTTFYFSLPLKK